MKKYEPLFNGQLGEWAGTPHTIHLKDNVNSYHGKPYKIPQLYEATLKLEVECLVKMFLKKLTIQNGELHVLSYLRKILQ